MGLLEIISFLSQPEVIGVLTLLFTCVVAISTSVYAVLTWSLVKETKKMREIQTNPLIGIGVQTREEWINFIDMKIENVGHAPAYNIKFKVISDFEYAKGQKLSELNLIKHGLDYLGPNQKIQFFLTSFLEDAENKKIPFEIEVSYENSFHETKKRLFKIDLTQLIGLLQLGEPPLYKMSKSIEKLSQNIEHLSSGFKKMKIIRYTKKEIEDENKKFLEAIKKQQKAKEKDKAK